MSRTPYDKEQFRFYATKHACVKLRNNETLRGEMSFVSGADFCWMLTDVNGHRHTWRACGAFNFHRIESGLDAVEFYAE